MSGEYYLSLDPYNFDTEEEFVNFYHPECLKEVENMEKYDINKKCDILSPSGQRAGACINFMYSGINETCDLKYMQLKELERLKLPEKEEKKYYTKCVILSGCDCPYYDKGVNYVRHN